MKNGGIHRWTNLLGSIQKDEQDVRNISISVKSNEEDMMTGNSGDPRKGMVLVLPSKNMKN